MAVRNRNLGQQLDVKNMIKKLISGVVLAGALTLQAQEKDRFNIGLHYNPPLGDNQTFSGGVDLRVRAVSLGAFHFGAGMSGSYRTLDAPYENYVVYNPHVYIEAQPFRFALKPYLSGGYAFYETKMQLARPIAFVPDAYDGSFYNGSTYKVQYKGATFAGGLRFDFAKILFADAGIRLYALKVNRNDNSYYYPNEETYGVVHLGFGFRF